MEQLTENMIRWAESKFGSTAYAGWCLSFIEDALEISNQIEIYGGDSAKESCRMYRDALRGGVPERGAFVFYDCLCPASGLRPDQNQLFPGARLLLSPVYTLCRER